MIETKVVRNGILNNLYFHEKLFCNLLPPGASKVYQTLKFEKIRKIQKQDESDRQKNFRFRYSVLIETKVVRNGILNNLYSDKKLPILQCSPSMSLQIFPNSQI